MTAGRLGKEQRAEARLLFFVFLRLYCVNGGMISLEIHRELVKLFAIREFRYNTFVWMRPRQRCLHRGWSSSVRPR